MKRRVPDSVVQAPPHSLQLVAGDSAVDFYVREDEFMHAKYPQQCSLEFALPTWDNGQVIGVAVLVQLAGRNASTFDRWLNVAKPDGLRILQLLASQSTLDLFLVSDRVFRSFSQRNVLSGQAAGIVATLRLRASWSDVDFETWRKRLDTLYPTSDALWRAARRMDD